MVRIKQRRERHLMDENGRLLWINGPEEHCYLSEQRQWRRGLSFDDVLDWKQCAPSGLVSQRFGSLQAVCEAYERDQITWYQDLYLRRMGDQMACHRAQDDYMPTAMKEAEDRGEAGGRPPWLLPEPSGPVCGLPPRLGSPSNPSANKPEPALVAGAGAESCGEVVHAHRRRRSSRA
ncbi:hypothetical protein KBY58_09850 [Cyanobium sp. HWJ4-Hawea]|uniref:hypothetical protein n=1 Tax=Cyanobium sp. HWJ4-Hawea TaxID=2823713 RepID=UPI0020CED823|nr:hypothetical protein [Cyanobium sp. HWJ4-Hawea]MCP9809735.1 hypothetical protein [Cyanobium sp. HWJ4-Hawea]